VCNALELTRQVAANAMCGRIGVVPLGVSLFQILKLAHKTVELNIFNLGGVLNVVFVVVIIEQLSQLGYTFVHGGRFFLRKGNNFGEKVATKTVPDEKKMRWSALY
jgi:hypothetical protein